jgi:hypothetical protein
VILNISFHPGSNAGCSRIIPDVDGRITDVPRFFPLVSRSFPDHPGRLPGLCRNVSDTAALMYNKLYQQNIVDNWASRICLVSTFKVISKI